MQKFFYINCCGMNVVRKDSLQMHTMFVSCKRETMHDF